MSDSRSEEEGVREVDFPSSDGVGLEAANFEMTPVADESTPRSDEVAPSAEDDPQTSATPAARKAGDGEEGDPIADQDGSDGEDTDGPSFAVLDGEILIKHWEVFVEPRGWNLEAVKEARVILLSGDEYSGKFTAALNVFPPSGDLGWLLYSRRDSLPLLAAVRHNDWPRDSIVLLEDAFDKGVREVDLKSTELELLQNRLRYRNSFLILTTNANHDELLELEVARLPVLAVKFERVLARHLDWYQRTGALPFEVAEDARKQLGELAKAFAFPKQLDQFCQLMAHDRPVGKDAIRKLAASPKILRKDLRPWFETLSEEAVLFALLAAVFRGMNRDLFEEVFNQALYRLRKDGCHFVPDPRQLNLVSLSELVHIHPEGPIEFAEQAVLKEARSQARGRMEVLDPIVRSALDSVQNKDERFWRSRWAVAAGLGRLGPERPERYERALEGLADARAAHGNSMAALAGSSLAATVYEGVVGRELIRRCLQSWLDSGDPHRLWAAAAALGRVFEANERGDVRVGDLEAAGRRARTRRELVAILKKLGWWCTDRAQFTGDTRDGARGKPPRGPAEWDHRRLRQSLREATAKTLANVSRLQPDEFTEVVSSWLSSKTPPLRTVDLGLQRLMGFIEKRGVDAFEGDTGKHLVQLVELILPSRLPIGAQGFRKLLRCLLAACDQSAIRELATWRLLELIHMGPSRVRQRLRSSFAGVEWRLWGDKVATLHRTVMTRSAALDGLLVDRPGRGRCLLVIDPDFLECSGTEPRKRAEEIERRQQAFRQIVRTLSAHLELWTVELGERTAHGPEPTSIRDPNEIGVYRRPRLVLPAVESMDCGSLRLIVVLGVGRITDLEDLGEAGLADRVLLVSVGDAWDAVEGVDTLTLPATLEAEKLGELDLRIVEYWARWVVEAGRADWEPVLRSLGVDPAALTNRRWFEEAAAQLADPSSVRGYPDVSRQYLVVLFWLASGDLLVALDHLVAWLGPEVKPQDLRWALAAAGARAMFRAYSASPRTAIGGVPQRLFEELADPLARTGSDGIETILEAVEKWLRNSDLVEFFAGDPVRGRGRLIRWADRFAPHRVEAFGKFLRRVESRLRTTWVEESPETEIADQLRASCAAGPVRPWPELGEGERMAVVIVDASDDRVLQTELAPRAAEFCHRLDRPGLRPALIRMGERYPVWVAGDSWANSSLVAIQARSNSRLIGPILESLTPEQTALVLLIGRHPPIDGEDLLEGPWGARLLALAPLNERGWHGAIPAFPRIRSGHNEIAAFWTVLTDHFGLTEVEVR
jgi:hypothetical protein